MESYKIKLFVTWLLSLGIIFSRFIHTVAWSFSLLNTIPTLGTDHILFMYSSSNGHLSCFYFLDSMNNASMNICVEIFMQTYVFNLLGHIPRTRMVSDMVNPCLTF